MTLHPESGEQRNRVISEARSWLHTPYHHMGALKGVGVDCAMLPIKVFSECGLIPDYKPAAYTPDWHLHRNDERYLEIVRQFAVETDRTDPGNFVVYRWGRCFAHGAIIVGWPNVINALVNQGVVLSRADAEPFMDRERLIFTVWE